MKSKQMKGEEKTKGKIHKGKGGKETRLWCNSSVLLVNESPKKLLHVHQKQNTHTPLFNQVASIQASDLLSNSKYTHNTLACLTFTQKDKHTHMINRIVKQQQRAEAKPLKTWAREHRVAPLIAADMQFVNPMLVPSFRAFRRVLSAVFKRLTNSESPHVPL